MKPTYLIASCAALLSLSPAIAQNQSWEKPYDGADATGSRVIGLWHFDGNGSDASGNKHDTTLRGKDSQFVQNGKFGGALSIESKAEPGDKSQGATTKNTENLNPTGAFTIEMWMSPSEQLGKDKPFSFLLDKKYFNYASDKVGANEGYFLGIRKASDNKFTLQAGLGFGEDSEYVSSLPQTFEANQWYHVAFTYDGKGEYIFYVGNDTVGKGQLKDRGAITPSRHALVIGDRVGSERQRFYGRIDEVRILNEAAKYVSGKVLLDTGDSRTAFYRMEKGANVQVHVTNDTLNSVKDAVITVNVANVSNKTVTVSELKSEESTVVSVPLDTNLRPGAYEATATVKVKALEDNTATFPINILSRSLPNQMPIVMWAGATQNYKELTDIGYTDELVNMTSYSKIWKEEGSGLPLSETSTRALRKRLDEMAVAGVGGLATISPGRTGQGSYPPEFFRTDRTGKEIENVNGLYPEIQKYFYNTGASVARAVGDLPGWSGALIDTEIRDHTRPSFSKIDRDAYRKFSGQDIPQGIGASRGVSYKAIPDFPANRIIKDDDPILTYYKWFWREGDGWNKLHSQLNDGLKSTGNKNIFTFNDPAVRAPSIWGSGGNVDYLNQWTYTYPDPLKNDLATNELFAMAEGRPGQKVMNMIQIIWYRTQTTRTPKEGQETEWEKATPDAKFISIAPDHLSEATWLQLAYPVNAIANHGWGSLGDHLGFKQGSYVTTNTETRKRMTELFQNVVKPLAPTLTQISDQKSDVAFLESFTSQIFDRVGTYGWGNGWGADSYMIARYADLQPQIIYEEKILRDGLDQYKVLFMTDVPVLTEKVANAIQDFQRKGGIIIGDENLAPGIQPDILLNKVSRKNPDVMKALMLEKAVELRKSLDEFYEPKLRSSNPEILTRLRQYGDSNYVFTVNDHRTYGDYVGQHKMVMEKGLPSQGQIEVNTLPSGSVYDLMNHRQVPTTRILGKVQFGVNLDGGAGNLFLVTPKPIGKLSVSSPSAAKRGKSIRIKVLLPDNANKKLSAIVPMNVTIRDAQGNVAEGSGYYGAKDGQLNIDLDVAPNDAVGKWQVEAVESLTGQKATATFTVS